MSISKWNKVFVHEDTVARYKPKKSVGQIISDIRREDRLEKLEMIDGSKDSESNCEK